MNQNLAVELFDRYDELRAELCRRDFTEFIKYFWDQVAHDNLIWNWHIDYLAERLSKVAHDASRGKPREFDLIINIPPGTTKSVTCSVMFPVWCWTKWPWMKFICASYSGSLALEQAEISRDLVRSSKFQDTFPNLVIQRDKDTKSNFRICKTFPSGHYEMGGNRYSTSVGGTLTGYHGHILIIDDPLDPNRAASEVEINSANRWIDRTLSTRKIDKKVTPTILIMQRLAQNDPSGHILAKKKDNVSHICLPGEIRTEGYRDILNPSYLAEKYVDGLLDHKRMPWDVLKDMEIDLGQYGYAGQIGQNPVPPSGGMFKVDHFQQLAAMPANVSVSASARYWDKAGTSEGGAYTAGVLMHRLSSGKFLISDVKRGQWASEERERIIRETAEADGVKVKIYHEQEPGSSGKESAQATIRNLAGFASYADRPTGDKVYRADPFSVAVNNGDVSLLTADWNGDFKDELRFFPFSTYKDQTDAASGAYSKLVQKKIARSIGRRK